MPINNEGCDNHVGYVTEVDWDRRLFWVQLKPTEDEPTTMVELDINKCLKHGYLKLEHLEGGGLCEGRILHKFDDTGIEFCQARWTQEEIDEGKRKGREMWEWFKDT